jgi:hypothetical protein
VGRDPHLRGTYYAHDKLLIRQARSTRVRDGVVTVTVTDGPFLEAKEALAGYCTIDVATPERAEEIAARWPDAQHWGMEVRALIHGGAEED